MVPDGLCYNESWPVDYVRFAVNIKLPIFLVISLILTYYPFSTPPTHLLTTTEMMPVTVGRVYLGEFWILENSRGFLLLVHGSKAPQFASLEFY